MARTRRANDKAAKDQISARRRSMRLIMQMMARAPRMLAMLVVRVVFFALARSTWRIVPSSPKGELRSHDGVVMLLGLRWAVQSLAMVPGLLKPRPYWYYVLVS
jgi:hypothetical protein